MGKQKKGRKHRSVNRTPRSGGQRDHHHHDHHGPGHSCFPRQTAPFQPVYRKELEFTDGRAYPATSQVTVEGQLMRFDLIASMYAVVQGEMTGPCADIFTALALHRVQQQPGLLPSIGEEMPSTIAELVSCFRKLIRGDSAAVTTGAAISASVTSTRRTRRYAPWGVPAAWRHERVRPPCGSSRRPPEGSGGRRVQVDGKTWDWPGASGPAGVRAPRRLGPGLRMTPHSSNGAVAVPRCGKPRPRADLTLAGWDWRGVRETAAMTTASPQPHRERQPLGRPLSALIPQTGPASAAEQAMTSLAALQTVPVHVGALQAAVALLEETARSADEEAVRDAAAATAALLRSAMAPSADG